MRFLKFFKKAENIYNFTTQGCINFKVFLKAETDQKYAETDLSYGNPLKNIGKSLENCGKISKMSNLMGFC